jgi:uncharacterized protein YuzE
MVRITYDPHADAAYIYLTEIGPVGVASSSFVQRDMEMAGINCDFNDANQLVGIEVLGASRAVPSDVLSQAEQLGG